MAQSSVDKLPLDLRERLVAMQEGQRTLESQQKFLNKAGHSISMSALSRWHNNERAQRLLREKLLTKEILAEVENEEVDTEKLTRLYQHMAAQHVAVRTATGNVSTDELAVLGRIVKEITLSKNLKPSAPELSDQERMERAKKMVTGT